MRIANATRHSITNELVVSGVVNLQNDIAKEVRELLTFEEIPSTEEITKRAEKIAELLHSQAFYHAMIGGAPFFMGALEKALRKKGIEPLYAFSKSEVIEKTNVDGSVVKTNIFKHVGFVRV